MRKIKVLAMIMILLLPVSAFAVFSGKTGEIISERWESGVPLGGIGCGKIELLTDGALGSFTINHNWERPIETVKDAFFAVYADNGDKKTAKILRLKDKDEYRNVSNIALTEYLGLFPAANINFKDAELPVDVALEAFSSLIPHNLKDSSLPSAVFTFTLSNNSAEGADASVLFSMENLLGCGGRGRVSGDDQKGNGQEIVDTEDLSGLLFTTDQKYNDERANVTGQYLIAVKKEADVQVSYCRSWDPGKKDVSFWREFADSGTISDDEKTSFPAGAVCAKVRLEPGQQRKLSFVFVWYMPQHITKYFKKIYTKTPTVSMGGLSNVFDGKKGTRWSTGHCKRAGEAVSFGIGREDTITKIVVDSSRSPRDSMEGYILEVSADGENWEEVEGSRAEENGGKFEITFQPLMTRYIKITQTGVSDKSFWSINEIYIYNKDEKLSFSPEDDKIYFCRSTSREITKDNGHYYLNYFSDAASVAGYLFEEKDRLFSQTKEWQDIVFQSSLPFWLRLKLINCAFPMFANTILTKDGRFAFLESPEDMNGALGSMEYRMASNAFSAQLFPQLDMKGTEMFAQCQQDNGEITRFSGNIYEAIGDADVDGAITAWPELSCVWVMQVLKVYRRTGDKDFLNQMYPGIKKALAFLKRTDWDRDFIPEGGSIYDYENLPRGSFIYPAICYLGALKSGIESARVAGDKDAAEAYRKDFENAQNSILNNMWNGKYFTKWYSPDKDKNKKKNDNSFIMQLAGDWMSRLCGTGRVIPHDKTKAAVKHLLAYHVGAFFPVPPMEVRPDGKAEKVKAKYVYLAPCEPYLGMEAIYEGFVDEGLDVINRTYYAAWIKSKNPWHQSLEYDSAGKEGGLSRHAASAATWHVLNALSGAGIDVNEGLLYINPQIPSNLNELHTPVFFSNFWGWLDYVPRKKELKMEVLKVFGGKPVKISQVVMDEDAGPVKLKNSFTVRKGAVLDLSDYWKW